MARIVLAFLIAIMVVGVAPLPSPAPGVSYGVETVAAKAKKDKPKKKRKKSKNTIRQGGCDLKANGSAWILVKDCVSTGPILLRGPMTFDGAQHQITLRHRSGEALQGNVFVLVGNGLITLRNVRNVGDGSIGECRSGERFVAITGQAQQVRIDNVFVGPLVTDRGCTAAVDLLGSTSSAEVDIVGSEFRDVGNDGIQLRRFGRGSFDRSTVSLTGFDLLTGALLSDVSYFSFLNSTVQIYNGIGIDIRSSSAIRIYMSTIRGSSSDVGTGVSIRGETADVALDQSTITAFYNGLTVNRSTAINLYSGAISDTMIAVKVGPGSHLDANATNLNGRPQGGSLLGMTFDAAASGTVRNTFFWRYDCALQYDSSGGLVAVGSGNIYEENGTSSCDVP